MAVTIMYYYISLLKEMQNCSEITKVFNIFRSARGVFPEHKSNTIVSTVIVLGREMLSYCRLHNVCDCLADVELMMKAKDAAG